MDATIDLSIVCSFTLSPLKMQMTISKTENIVPSAKLKAKEQKRAVLSTWLIASTEAKA
jgi:hypothetical protein